MEPEISHRCPSCGATSRTRAQFCPQCGKPLKKTGSDASPTPDAKSLVSSSDNLKTRPLPSMAEVTGTALGASTGKHENAVDATDSEPAPSAQAVAPLDEGQAKKPRVKEAARGMVEDNVRPRVEKLRQASNVVFDEVAIDPSLRFVLIAVVLFIIFVALLLLSFIK